MDMNSRIDNIAKDFVKQALLEEIPDRRILQKLKNRFSTKYGISSLTSMEILRAYNEMVDGGVLEADLRFEKLIRKRSVRSLSGIASVTAITKDYDCPGKCIYCPKEPDMPKSYLSNEPAVMRAILNDFDPYRQVISRLKGLARTGHSTDKIEMIISGGTFNFYPARYQKDFIRGIFNGLNYDAVTGVRGVDKSGQGSGGQVVPKSRSLKKAHQVNETTKHRCVGLSVETRPDYIDREVLKHFREMGVTKIEVGVQCLDDEIYKLNCRGHSVQDVRDAMKLMKDAGFKINVHFMPNLYGSGLEKDFEMFKELFDDSDFRPDWLKIYPCVVVPYSPLAKLYKDGKHKTYTDRELIDLLVRFKKIVPDYCRITRLYRDIPADSILGGSKVSNLRQYVQADMKEKGLACRCIRCREIKDDDYSADDVELRVQEYDSSGGHEFFISFDDVKQDRLIGYLRLRVPSQVVSGEKHWMKDLEGASVIREIHIFGEHVKVGEKVKKAGQHKGYGRQLIEKAAELTKKEGLSKLAVISGVGVREYYRKLGFEDGELYQYLKV
jgi:elongator complex protein 3